MAQRALGILLLDFGPSHRWTALALREHVSAWADRPSLECTLGVLEAALCEGHHECGRILTRLAALGGKDQHSLVGRAHTLLHASLGPDHQETAQAVALLRAFGCGPTRIASRFCFDERNFET